MLLLPSTSVNDLLVYYIAYFPKSLPSVFRSSLCCYSDIACHLKCKSGTCQFSLSLSSPHCFNWNCNCKRVVDFCWHMVHPSPMWAQLDAHSRTHAHLSLLSGDCAWGFSEPSVTKISPDDAKLVCVGCQTCSVGPGDSGWISCCWMNQQLTEPRGAPGGSD